MATRTCPECGSQYVASVRRCIDCDVLLVDQPSVDGAESPDATTSSPVGSGDQVAYELEGWGNQLKVALEGMLDRSGVRRVWEGGALVVAGPDEALVDELIATVEGTDIPELDDDIERVALEIEDLDRDSHTDLEARLHAAGVAHSWSDDGDLVVAAADEEVVMALVEEVLNAEADDDGLDASEALGRLYVATDKLLKAPLDPRLLTAYRAADDEIQALGVPYGLSAGEWASLQGEVAAITRGADAASDPDEDEEVRDEVDADDRDGSDEGESDADGPDESDDPDEDDAEDDLTPVERLREEIRALREHLREYV